MRNDVKNMYSPLTMRTNKLHSFTMLIKGLCKHIEKKLDMGMLITRAIRNRDDIDIMIPEDPDPTDPIELKNGNQPTAPDKNELYDKNNFPVVSTCKL